MIALKKIDVDEKSTQALRAREVLRTARLNLIGHVAREDRVAAALKLARDNIVEFDPKRLGSMRALTPTHEQKLQRQAAAARQERVKRTLGAARATLRRLSHIKPPSHNSEIVQKTTENARLALEAPSPASRRKALPRGSGTESLNYRFEVFREAVPEAMGKMKADLWIKWQRENDGLRRELDVIHREFDLVHRTLAGLRATDR